MNTRIQEHLEGVHKTYTEYKQKLLTLSPKVVALLPELSDDCYCNAYYGSWTFTCTNRDDLQVLMRLAPKWSKSSYGDSITYSADIDDVSVSLCAAGGALPPTCHLVEEEYEVEARPARKEKRMVVKCKTVEVM